MGRKKLEMKRIEENSARMVCFSKRRNGLIKKAKELSALCDVDVAAVIFSNRGKLYEYCSADSMAQVLQEYQSRVESDKDGCDTEGLYSKNGDYLTYGELLKTVGSELKEPRVDQLSVAELGLMQKQLETAIMEIRSTKTKFMTDAQSSLQEKEKMLEEEKKHLNEIVEDNNCAKKKKVVVDLNIATE
ncbi:hypothetical protein ABFS82_11G073100 [Erythranthe guttata]|uniref:MADS-box domain-containing protein n=1 Tax=Erythranthe guttata TaxID=4155 RepID=A0A022R0M9_ERYGU|nr:PREDICTED: agamous-like MADS-box protein AGL27 [Erythranthe guttata]EYU33459.1 hypothetical protein MIMGU_mgv1a014491mg [Erythranthe guttata]|eukprot:XP_012842155.1 PREDICTED: agamous-like MADS-box protein AGL27 [Erythranthe guttata]